MTMAIRKTKSRLKQIKFHSEASAIRLCLSSLEKDAILQGYELAAAHLKVAQYFLNQQFRK